MEEISCNPRSGQWSHLLQPAERPVEEIAVGGSALTEQSTAAQEPSRGILSRSIEAIQARQGAMVKAAIAGSSPQAVGEWLSE